VLETLKYVHMAIAPFLEAKLEHEYFIFQHSAMILLWSFVAAMVVLAGAEWTARRGRENSSSDIDTDSLS
jgi:membrane protein